MGEWKGTGVLSKQDLERAQTLVYQHLKPTPAYAWPLLSEAVGCQVWVKHENHTPTGAFKVRGGLVYLHELVKSHPKTQIVTATRGNHGQSIPYAAALYGCEVKVFVPHGNGADKNAAMQAWGAQLHIHGTDFDEARQQAERVARDLDAHLVPSYHEHLVRGVATYGAELFADAGELDTVYVPVGMGSGASSLVCVRNLLGLRTEIVGVVAAGADAFAQSFAAGRIVESDHARTFADGMATRVPHPQAFEVLSTGLARVVCVTDDEIAEAMRLLYRTTHNVAEGAGAAATAALLQERARGDHPSGQRCGVILTGGNIDAVWFNQVLSGSTPEV